MRLEKLWMMLLMLLLVLELGAVVLFQPQFPLKIDRAIMRPSRDIVVYRAVEWNLTNLRMVHPHVIVCIRFFLQAIVVVVVVICICTVVIDVCAGGFGAREWRIRRLHATLRFSLPCLNVILLHGRRPIYSVQFVIQAASVTDWFAQGVASPKRGLRCLTVAAGSADASRSRRTAARFLLVGATGATIPTEAFVEIALVRHGSETRGSGQLVLRRCRWRIHGLLSGG